MLHVISTRQRLGHFSDCVGDSLRLSEEIANNVAPFNAIISVVTIIVMMMTMMIIIIIIMSVFLERFSM